MNLEVGMYIRTNLGIEKITSLESEYNCLIAGVGTEKGYIQKKRVVKASRNLIDLIEVGDYVNGYKVLIKSSECGRPILVYGINTNDKQIAITIYEEDIKTIVTKEQFANMEYKVGE